MSSSKKIIVNKPIAWAQLNLSEQVKSVYFEEDEDGNIKGMPVILVDPYAIPVSGAFQNTFFPRGLVALTDGANPGTTDSITSPEEDIKPNGLWTNSYGYVFPGDPTAVLPKAIRTPSTFKTVAVAAAPGTTDIWTPAGGKKIRLMGLVVNGGGTIAAAAGRTYTIFEETAGTIFARGSAIIAILGQNFQHYYDFNPNGILLSTADKKLQITTAGGTYTAGADAVTAWGTEE